jgi:hypothetical protein
MIRAGRRGHIERWSGERVYQHSSMRPSLIVMWLRRTYTGYSIGCAVVWAVILTVVAVTYPDRLDTFLLVGAGWLIGWVSATIARSVYPPPRLN